MADNIFHIYQSVHAAKWHDALCTWVNGGGQLKAELQLAADMICWHPATQ